MINLEEVARFHLAKPGTGLVLAADKRRIVRLELNTSEPCQLRLQTGSSDLRFLANVDGRETITFIADGDVTIWPDCDGEVWWFTPEMETTAVEIEGPEIFTKIANRRVRNPELERIAAKMQENADRRMAQLMAEVSGVVGSLRQENETLKSEVKRVRKPKATPDAVASGEPDGAGQGDTSPPEGGADGTGGADE